MKKSILALLIACASGILYAQEADTTYWKRGGLASLTFTQVSLNNWAAGGDNSVSLAGLFNVYADYTKDKITWTNTLEMGYGLIRQGEDGDFEKTDDRINAITQFGYKLTEKNLFWSSLLDFRTQFDEGLDGEGNIISKFMAPGYLLVATGLEWKPSEVFGLTYSPIGGKFTFVTDQDLADAGAFGVDPAELDGNGDPIAGTGSQSRAELGSFVKMNFNKEIVTNVTFESRLELFANYVEEFGNIDVNWQNLLVMKVNDFLTVNWQTQLIYDDDIKIEEFDSQGELIGASPKTQFKSVFGVGLAYRFGVTRVKAKKLHKNATKDAPGRLFFVCQV